MRRHRILVLSYSRLDADPRVRRHLEALCPRWDVTAAGLTDPAMRDVSFLPICHPAGGWRRRARFAARVAVGRYLDAYWPHYGFDAAVVETLLRARPDLVLANDVETLPLSVRIGETLAIPLVYDAHEFAPAQFDDRLLWRLAFSRFHETLCREFLGRPAVAFTVSPGIALEYERRFGRAFDVLMNAPRYRELPVVHLGQGPIRLVHHGGAISSRRIEAMIRAAGLLGSGYSLELYLVPTPGNPGYLDRLARLAAVTPNVSLRPPLPYEALLETTNRCDIGLYALPPSNFNQRFALPNKLFEYIQARLAVVTGPSPEMAALVRKHGIGSVAAADTPEAIAKTVAEMRRADIERYKQNADRAARLLTAEREEAKLVSAISSLLAGEHRT